MKKKQKPSSGLTIVSLTKKWETFWEELNATNMQLVSFLDTQLRVNQKIKAKSLIDQWEKLTKAAENYYDALEEIKKTAETVEPIEVKLPWEDDKFKSEWENWKQYLVEQHGIVISSRAEQKQLDTLKKLAGDNEAAAFDMLDYSMSNFYKMVFQLDIKKEQTTKKTKNRKKDDDFS